MIVTRFAPSPTGYLHLGSVYSAVFAKRAADDANGRYLVRIEDIDAQRSKPEFTAGILTDLSWLGLAGAPPVRHQSSHLREYQAGLARLDQMELLYPCFCTRTDIAREIQAAGGAPQGPDGPAYPGTCRTLTPVERDKRMKAGSIPVWRLRMEKACEMVGRLHFHERNCGQISCAPERFGDVVLARKDSPTSYHLSVTVDDALQGVTLVTRGKDLLPSTDVHRLLQALLDLPEPEYWHHELLLGPDGKRLAKRDKSMSVRALRAHGHTATEIVEMTEKWADDC